MSLWKRLIKSPKLYFVDSGLACRLLGIDSEKTLNRSPFLGPLFEGFVASEVLKQQVGKGRPGKSIAFAISRGSKWIWSFPRLPASSFSRRRRPRGPRFLRWPILSTRLARAVSRYAVSRFVIHRPSVKEARFTGLRAGVRAVGVGEFIAFLEKVK